MAVNRSGLPHALDGFFDEVDGTIPANAGGTAGGSYLGTVASVTGLSVREDGFGPFRKTTFTFSDVDLALTDEAGVVAYGGLKVYDFPEALVNVLGSVADLAITKSSAGVNADWDGDFAVGTVTASNNATLATTEQNIIPTTATPQAVSGATTAKGVATTASQLLDGTTTAVDLYVNFLVDDADHDVTTTPCNLILNGTVSVYWLNVGDLS